tara:strand:- start:2755 stop:3594 length:840 start_codon:yes stop_codon:yes gene_type:complete
MNQPAEHPLVTSYLSEFDDVSAPLSMAHRLELREEIASHLHESVPISLSNAEASAAIAAFGSPAEILGYDGIQNQVGKGSGSRKVSRILVLVAAIVVMLGGAAALLVWLWVTPFSSEMTPGGVGQPVTVSTSVVNAHPNGPARTLEGTAYFEYLAAIEAMPEPLPSGAAYPVGVPEGLGSGQSDDGVVQSGLGATVAHFTWLCAWEAEYLSAASEDDAERQVAAETTLELWPSYGYVSDRDAGWASNVLEPLSFGDATGLQKDFPQTCAQAGILNVTAP